MAKLASIQILRIFAALLVVVAHFRQELKGYDPENIRMIDASFGVDLFFVISGFVISMASVKQSNPFSFMSRRITRLVPLYWILTLFVFSLSFIFPQMLKSADLDLAQLLKSLFFIPFQKESGLVQPVLFVGWTLNYEMFFYAVFALSLYLFDRPLLPLTVFFSALVLIGQTTAPEDTIAKFYTDSIILKFVAGMWIFAFYSKRRFIPIAAAGIIAGLGLTGIVLLTALQPDLPSAPFTLLFSAMMVFGAVSLNFKDSRLMSYGIVLGDASYALYLTHPFIGRVMGKILDRFSHLNALEVTSIFALFLALALVASVLIYRGFERPITLSLNRLLDEPGRRRAPN